MTYCVIYRQKANHVRLHLASCSGCKLTSRDSTPCFATIEQAQRYMAQRFAHVDNRAACAICLAPHKNKHNQASTSPKSDPADHVEVDPKAAANAKQ